MEMTPLSPLSYGLAFAACALLLLSDRYGRTDGKDIPQKAHTAICALTVLLGCMARLVRLTSLPGGLSAEEALVAVQAKALWQTGHFVDARGFAAQLPQWTGEPAGPLLCVFTAPFAGIFGITGLTTRLPLALFSCLAMPAAYLTGTELSGRKAGRWFLLFWALSPFFVLTARLTAAASLSLCILPWALALAFRGLRKPGYLLPASVLMGLLTFTENLYFYLAPWLIILLAVAALRSGRRAGQVLPAAAAGLVICLPGILTAIACREAGADIDVGPLLFPHLEEYDKARNLFTMLKGKPHPDSVVFDKLWAVLTGGFFQNVMHSNISYTLFVTGGMTALGLFSVPLALAGALILLTQRIKGERFTPAVRLAVLFGCATLLAELFFGSVGEMEVNGTTSIWDHAQWFPYTALLAVAALCRVQEKNRWCARGFLAVFAVGFTAICLDLFGGGYAQNANVYFTDYREAVESGETIHAQSGAKLYVTSSVYPHLSPDEAARMMLYCMEDADLREVAVNPDKYGEIYWPEGEEEPEKGCIHVVLQREIRNWIWEDADFEYLPVGRFAVLKPRTN